MWQDQPRYARFSFMAETEQTKVCPLCAETIKAAAKVCPYCRHWLKKWSFLNPRFNVTVFGLIYLGFIVAAVIFFGNKFGPKENFAEYRNEITVVNATATQRIYGSNLWNTVVGTLTNRSDVSWKDVGVEAAFFDKSGKMIDAITVGSLEFNGQVILPHGVTAFKIEGKACRPPTNYWTNTVNVRWAKDANSLF
jgi:hypothetical protein